MDVFILQDNDTNRIDKTCPKCNQLKNKSEFWKNSASKDGLGYMCKQCDNKSRMARRRLKGMPVKRCCFVRKDGKKQCSHCEQWKDELDFTLSKTRRDGLSSLCKDCRHCYMHKRKDKTRESNKKSWKKHGDAYRKQKIEYGKSERGKLTNKKYQQSQKGKLLSRITSAKRKRNLSYILFPIFGNALDNIITNGYHCNNAIVVNIPKGIHMNNLGNNHRQQVADYFSEHWYIDIFQELL